MDQYVIRVYLAKAISNKVGNPIPYRIYDNGITVGEMIDEEWTAYERLVTKDQIEIRKIIQCEPALDYLNIESYNVDVSDKNGVLEVSSSGIDSGLSSSSFIQWSSTKPIPSEIPASLVPIIQSLLETLEVDNCTEKLLGALQQSLPTLQQQYPSKLHHSRQQASLNQKQRQQQPQQYQQQQKYPQQQHKYQQQQEQQQKYQQQQLKPQKALQHKSHSSHSYTKKPSTTSSCLIQLD